MLKLSKLSERHKLWDGMELAPVSGDILGSDGGLDKADDLSDGAGEGFRARYSRDLSDS